VFQIHRKRERAEATAELIRTKEGAETAHAVPFAGACAGTSLVTGAAADLPLSSLFDGAGAGAEGWSFVGGSITGDGAAGSGAEDGVLAA
jgi:hypothetical protein